MSTGLVAVVLIFSLPIIKTISLHFQKQSQLKHQMLKDELELEKLKHENFLIETEKMKLELEKMSLNGPNNDLKL
ncbi:hypothetical protein ACFSO7_04635 [Bacillus sp. CGMCC 1.16607]|uniref:hypothetical protein n=1 Tax=Bacillus sp. CGMCC 1.16607 TaxID=3351842 RepID=UPI0036366C28